MKFKGLWVVVILSFWVLPGLAFAAQAAKPAFDEKAVASF